MSASPSRPSPVPPVQYKGSDLEAERGPGLGCFRFQLVLLLILVVLTPISVVEDWPAEASAALLFLTIVLLLFAGQTIIFLLRLVAADRAAGRRRPMASRTRTVGEIEEADSNATGANAAGSNAADANAADANAAMTDEAGSDAVAKPDVVLTDEPETDATDRTSAADASDEPLPNPPDVRQ